MKTFKTWLATIAALLCSITANAYDFHDASFGYNITSEENKEVECIGYFGDGNSAIPSTVAYNNIMYSVTSIANNAFISNKELVSITIPESVTSIGDDAFYNCSSLTSINMPENSQLTSIGEDVFCRCSSLTSINIPESVTSIGEGAFSECSSLTLIYIPESVTSIGEGAFYGCGGKLIVNCNIPPRLFYECRFTSVTLGDGVTSIGDYAFTSCLSLTSITLPKSVTSIGDGAFFNCDGLTNITIPESVTHIGSSAFNHCSNLTSITVSENSQLTSIGSSAFSDCNNLTSITIPENSQLTSIGSSAFSGCSNLASITIPKSVTSIGDKAFHGCGGKVIVNCNIPQNAFFENDITSVTIGEDVTSIGHRAFFGCSSLNSIEFSENSRLTDIDSGAFSRTGIVSITIPEGVTTIGVGAFSNCSNLTSITIPESVTNIEDYAFSGCSNLTSITVSENSQLTSIGSCAFSGCNNLTSITIPERVTNIESSAFSDCNNLTTITIPENSQLTSIGHSAFKGCSSLTSITIPKSVTIIEQWAFDGCSNLTSITFLGNPTMYNYDINVKKVFWKGNTRPNTNFDSAINYIANSDYVSYINFKVYPMLGNMFEVDGITYIPTSMSERTCDIVDYDCNRMATTLDIEATVTYKNIEFTVNNISDYAFYGNKHLEKVTLANQGSVGTYAFANCSKLVTVNIAEGVTLVGNALFEGCNELSIISVAEGNAMYDSRNNCNAVIEKKTNKLVAACNQTVIPESVTAIGDYAFSGCKELSAINIHENIMSIGDYAFSGCSNLADVIIEDRTEVLTLGSNSNKALFSDCPLNSVYIGGKISYDTSSSKGYSPFSNNTSLRTVTITDKVETIYPYEFYNCSALKSVTIGDGASTIGDYAFSGCTSLESFTLGSMMKTIGVKAFLGCGKITAIMSGTINPPVCGANALDDLDKWNCTLYTPIGYKSAYQAADQWKEFLLIEDTISIKRYELAYMVNDTVYHVDSLAYEEAIILPDEPIKEGHTFNGWEGLPETMPIRDVVVNALFTKNKYLLSYVVDGEVHMADSVAYSDTIVLIDPLEKEGYTFSGWIGAPETMPAKDTTIVGTFVVNSYLLTYRIDGDTIQSDSIAYGSEITMLEAPEKVGYTFDGWDQIITVMPAEDVVINGSYTRLPIENYIISDSDENFTLEEDLLCNKITYTRTFKNTNWNALYVPFEIPLSALADNYDIAYINDIHTWANEESGEIEKMTMEVIKITDADAVLNANHPYLIRPKSEEAKQMTLVVTDATLYAAEEMTLDCSSMYTKFEVTGSYRRRTVEDLKGSLVLGGGTWITMTEGTMNPFRLFLTITNREGSPVKINPEAAKSISIRTRGEDDGTTDIEYTEEAKTIELIYDLHGRRVSAPQKGGLYIVNGKKIIY